MLQGLLVKRAQVFGKARDGLYLLEPSGVRNSTSLVPPSVLNQNVFSQLSVLSASSVSDVSLWHIRLGHLPFSAMKHLSFISLPFNFDCFCQICPKARQTRIPFPLSQIKSTRAFELIHVDVWGPYKESTYNGFKYFLTVVDDYSRAVWTFLMSTKSNAFGLLKNFLTMVERQFGVKVQKLRTDNAFELGKGSQEAAFLASQGVLHQTSCVATPQQNGVVERKHRHLLEIARALLFQSKLPLSYWGECVLTATYLINRLPSRVLKGRTPYFVLFKQKPSYELLKCFGCLCFVSTLTSGRGKFDPRAKPCVFLGYPLGQKGYKVLELDTRRVSVSRDVYFYENQYPFASTTTPTDSFFPVTSSLEHSVDSSSEHIKDEPVIPSSPLPSLPTFSNPSNSSTLPSTSGTSSISQPRSFPYSPLPISLPEVRKSTRTHNPPSYLQEYVCNSVFLTDLTNSCFNAPIQPMVLPFTALSPINQSILNSTSYLVEPTSYSQASLHPGWQEAMEKELEALELNKTWEVVPLPSGTLQMGLQSEIQV